MGPIDLLSLCDTMATLGDALRPVRTRAGKPSGGRVASRRWCRQVFKLGHASDAVSFSAPSFVVGATSRNGALFVRSEESMREMRGALLGCARWIMKRDKVSQRSFLC